VGGATLVSPHLQVDQQGALWRAAARARKAPGRLYRAGHHGGAAWQEHICLQARRAAAQRQRARRLPAAACPPGLV